MPDLYGISELALAQAAGVRLDTARRWKRSGRVPAPLRPFVLLRLRGDLDVVAPEWSGWRLTGNELWSPEGFSYTPGTIRSFTIMHQLTRALISERYEGRPAQIPLSLGATAASLAFHDPATLGEPKALADAPAARSAFHRFKTPLTSRNATNATEPHSTAARMGSVAG